MGKLTKQYTVRTKAVDAEAGIYQATISTETKDRQGDIVRAAGAQLGNYLKNPVVLWAHDYNLPPVAKAISIERKPGIGISATFQFAPRGVNSQADTVRELWAAGFLNATSIGFIPLDSRPVDPNNKWGPQEFTSWELLEFSIVPVPANQEALRLAMKQLKTKKYTSRNIRLSEISAELAKKDPRKREYWILKSLDFLLDEIRDQLR